MENTGVGEPKKVEYHRNFYLFFEIKSLSMAQAALKLGILSQHPE